MNRASGSAAWRRSMLMTSWPRAINSLITCVPIRPLPPVTAIRMARLYSIDVPPRSARPAIISCLVALALYAITIPGTYVYDDRYIVQNDPRVSEIKTGDRAVGSARQPFGQGMAGGDVPHS